MRFNYHAFTGCERSAEELAESQVQRDCLRQRARQRLVRTEKGRRGSLAFGSEWLEWLEWLEWPIPAQAIQGTCSPGWFG